MVIKTKKIVCATREIFNTWKLPSGPTDTSADILWSSVVYIGNTAEIWTHGRLFGGLFSNEDDNRVSLSIGGVTKVLSLHGHTQSYTTLTGSTSVKDQAILSSGEANKWVLKTLGKNAFSNDSYLLVDGTAKAAEKVINSFIFSVKSTQVAKFDGSAEQSINLVEGDNVHFSTENGNITISADKNSDTVNTAGATNKVDTKLFIIGAQAQTASPQTYSNQYTYIGSDNCLYSLGKKVLTDHQAIYNLDIQTKVGESITKVITYDPNSANNSITLVQGSNVTLTSNADNKTITISSENTTYDFYNLIFKQGESVIDTYKPTTSPNKILKAGTNITFTGGSDEIVVSSIDTKNTAGATDKLDTKMFLIGATDQNGNIQTYTNSNVYIGTNNKLYSNGKEVSTSDHTHNYAGSSSPGGAALTIALNPNGLLSATYGSYGGILQDSSNGPSSGVWSNRIKILHNDASGYYTELAQNFTGTAGLWHRRNSGGTVTDWVPVIDKSNFKTYLDGTYVIRGNDPNVLTNYVRYSISTGLTMSWEWGDTTPTHIWGTKGDDSSKAYVFNGDNIRAFANAVNKAGDTMTGTLKVTEIQATNGNGLVIWNGTTYTYLGMQAGTTYIRSGETDLQHRYNGTDYTIWDERNLVGLRPEHHHNTINFIDSRNTTSTPQEHPAGVWLDFKTNANANLDDGGNYTGILTVRKYGSTLDWTGGKAAQLGFTDNSNVWVRFGTGTSWEAWKQLATTGWADGKFLPLSGGTMTGNIIMPNNKCIYQNQASSSNYTPICAWLKGGISQDTYDPQIGHYNFGGGDNSGSITILPYATSTDPWMGNVGLFVYKGNAKIDGNLIWHAGNDGSGSGLDADMIDGYHASNLWRSDGGTWNPSANIALGATANGQEWSFDISRNGYTGCSWHVWDSSLSSMLIVTADDGKVSAPYGFIGNLSGTATNADMLDGKHAGVQNGQVVVYISFPGSNELVSLGYNTEANKNNTEEYLKGICKWAIDNYVGNSNCTLIGIGYPNSSGMLILHLYSDSGKDSTTGLPRYCEGVFFHLSDAACTFGTWEYTWKWSHSTWNGNALTATKLQTSRAIWGQSFDGSAPISGDMTGVGSITASGQISTSIATGTKPIDVVSTTLCTNLNSDMLDGLHNGEVTAAILRVIDTRGVQESPGDLPQGLETYFKYQSTVGISSGYDYTGILSFKPWGDFSGGPAYQMAFTESPNLYVRQGTADGWGSWKKIAFTTDTVSNSDMLDGVHSYGFARADQYPDVDLNTVNGFGIMCNPMNVYATTAHNYPIEEAGMLIYGQAAYNSANQIYGSYYSNRWFARGGGYLSKTAWKEFAFTTDNVASATQLQTSRTLWGQYFNGSDNVSGNLTGVGSIAMSGTISGITRIDGDNSYSDLVIKKTGSCWSQINVGGTYATNVESYISLNLKSQGTVQISAGSDSNFLWITSTKVRTNKSFYSGTTQITSDIRLKNRISSLNCDMNEALKFITPFYYTKKGEGDNIRLGVSANDVRHVFPELVSELNDPMNKYCTNYYTVDYAALGAVVAINGYKELRKLVDARTRRINKLELRIAKLTRKVRDLSKIIDSYHS